MLFRSEAIHRFRGNAYDLKTGAFVYSENHSAFHKGNDHIYSRVSYRDKAGHEFASKLITFTPVKTQPTYELNDSRDGYMEGIRREGGKTVYYARRARDQQTKSKAVSAPQPAVFDAGFDYFVQEHFDAVCAGNNKSFYFAVPVAQLDLCLYAKNHGICAAEAASASGLTEAQVRHVWTDIDRKRSTTRPLHLAPILVEDVGEVR